MLKITELENFRSPTFKLFSISPLQLHKNLPFDYGFQFTVYIEKIARFLLIIQADFVSNFQFFYLNALTLQNSSFYANFVFVFMREQELKHMRVDKRRPAQQQSKARLGPNTELKQTCKK